MSTLYRRRTEARRRDWLAFGIRWGVAAATMACWVATAYLIWQLYMMAAG